MTEEEETEYYKSSKLFHLFEHGFTYVLRVNKVAISSSFTLALIVLSAIGFAKICYRAIFGDDLL